jgi:hypothetical protein
MHVCVTVADNGPTACPQMTHELIWSIGGIIPREETEELGEKPVTVSPRPSEIPYRLPWKRTRA